MRRLMVKAIVMIAFISFAQTVFPQTELGIGLVSVKFDDKTVLHFYDRPLAQRPVHVVQFFDDKSINSWNIRDLESVRKWLSPESLWLDYGSFVFRCRSARSGWFEVIVNNKTGQSFWIRRSTTLKFMTWESFLKDKFAVVRSAKHPQKIFQQPSSKAKEIQYKGKDCFEVKSLRGDWIQVKAANHCVERGDGDSLFREGWVKWRRGNMLLVDYFITS